MKVVTYFTLVHAAHTATPPPTVDINGGNSVAPGKDQDSLSSEGSATDTPSALRGTSLSGVEEKKAEKAAEGKAVKRWRRKLLKEVLRSKLGFNTVVKDSTLSGAGLGLFVEGSAPEGAVVAIYPVSHVCKIPRLSEIRYLSSRRQRMQTPLVPAALPLVAPLPARTPSELSLPRSKCNSMQKFLGPVLDPALCVCSPLPHLPSEGPRASARTPAEPEIRSLSPP